MENDLKYHETELVDDEDYHCPKCMYDLKDLIENQALVDVAGDFEVFIVCPECATRFTLLGEREMHYYLIVET